MEEIYCFAGNPLDRMFQRRQDADWIAALLRNPQTRVLPFFDLQPVVRDGAALDWQKASDWRAAIEAGALSIFLGMGDGCAYFAVDAGAAAGGDGAATMDARTLAATIAGGDAAIVAEARSMLDWHRRHGFCAACGQPSAIAAAGWTRRCPACKAHHFPRVDPVVIMLATRGDHCLLGRGRRRPGARFSCLAGFMEPGETIEEAVRREVAEEAGIRVGRVRYLATQPWPFPSSLMIGCLGEALSEEITIDPDELGEARWFARAEVKDMVGRSQTDQPNPDGLPTLPPPLAIGHQIARRWAFGIDRV